MIFSNSDFDTDFLKLRPFFDHSGNILRSQVNQGYMTGI